MGTPATTEPPPRPTGDLQRLRDFRAGLHSTFTSWPDASFELCEAMLCAPGPICSVPTLSLEPVFRRPGARSGSPGRRPPEPRPEWRCP